MRLVEPGRNLGFAAGCNLGAEHADGRDPRLPEPGHDCGSRRAPPRSHETLEDDSIAIAMARLRLLYEPTLLNSAGTVVHISGLGWAGGFAECASTVPVQADVVAPSGAAMAIRADEFRRLGGFRPQFFMYHEDQELGWRVRLSGKRVVIAPEADVYHDYEFDRHARKRYYLERNRIAFLALSFSARTLLVLAPVLLATELGMWLLAAKQGGSGQGRRLALNRSETPPWVQQHRWDLQERRESSAPRPRTPHLSARGSTPR